MERVHHHVALRPEQVTVPEGHAWRKIPLIAGAAGVLGIVASLIYAGQNPRQMAFSWLFAFMFCLSIAIGSAYFVLIHWAVQGGWGIVLRRIAEITMGVIPLFVVLFLPIVLGMQQLYPWSRPGAAEGDALLRWKEPYLNPSFFLLRAAVYLACWSLIGLYWYRSSRSQDATGDPAASVRMRRFAGPAVITVALTQTFACFDWIMSLDPHWYSTIFGVYYFAGSTLSFLAFLAIVAVAMQRAGLLRDVVTPEHLHDVGKLLFAFTCFWAYISFSQFFLIWYGNLPEETIWYKVRLDGSWKGVSALLAIGHFVLPFLFFMGRTVKRRSSTLVLGAVWILLMHLLDVYWLIMPAMHPQGFAPSLADFVGLVAVGGMFIAAVSWLAMRGALVPLKDPRLEESLAFENA